MRISKRNVPEFCCNSMGSFCGRVECVFRPWDYDGPLYIHVGVVSGSAEFEFKYCPFCGVRIDIVDE